MPTIEQIELDLPNGFHDAKHVRGNELRARDSMRLEATADNSNGDTELARFLRWNSKGMIAFDEMIRRARVLSCPTRVNLWNSLGDAGRHPMDLAREFELAPSTVTYHLTALVRARLAEVYGHGASRVYVWSGTKLGIVTDAELREFMVGGGDTAGPP